MSVRRHPAPSRTGQMSVREHDEQQRDGGQDHQAALEEDGRAASCTAGCPTGCWRYLPRDRQGDERRQRSARGNRERCPRLIRRADAPRPTTAPRTAAPTANPISRFTQAARVGASTSRRIDPASSRAESAAVTAVSTTPPRHAPTVGPVEPLVNPVPARRRIPCSATICTPPSVPVSGAPSLSPEGNRRRRADRGEHGILLRAGTGFTALDRP